MSNNGEMNFDDLAQVEVPVSIGGKKYVLKEATADAVRKWRNAQLKATKLGDNGKPISLEGMADTEPLLVSLCLFEEVKESGKPDSLSPVSLSTVSSWPNRIVGALFAEATKISDLEGKKDQVQDPKKSPAATPAGSS